MYKKLISFDILLQSDMQNLAKKYFPIFKVQKDLVYLDSGATALKPKEVTEKMEEYLSEYSANIHRGVYDISEKASEEYEQAREKVAKFIKAEASEVIFTKNTTEALNLLAFCLPEIKGQVMVSRLEHHANFVPWQRLAKNRRLEFKILELDEDWLLKWQEVDFRKVGLLALTQISNVVGLVVPVAEIILKAKQANPEIICVVDGAQAVAHVSVDVIKLGCDFYAFSGHKVYGPTGVGVLWGRKKLLEKMEPFMVGGGMISEVGDNDTKWAEVPDKFEAGTPPIGEVIALGTALDFVEKLGWDEIAAHDRDLMLYAREQLEKIAEVTIYAAKNSVTILAFTVKGVHAHDVGEILNRSGVAVRSGHHCAQPLHRKLGVPATSRISWGIYNEKSDIDKLVMGIEEIKKVFKING